MADELDPRMERQLRVMFREEVDALPFTLRPDDLERRAEERRRARSRRRLVLAAAAAVAIVVGGIAVVQAPRLGVGAPPTPALTTATLPSADRLVEVLTVAMGSPDTILLQAERPAASAASEVDVGDVSGRLRVDLAFACSGSSIRFEVRADGAIVAAVPAPCTGGAWARVVEDARMANAGTARLVVVAPAGVAWRLVVGAAASGPGGTP